MTKVARVVHNDGRRMLITTAAATLLTAVIVTGWTTVDSSMRAYAVLLGCIVAWGLVSGIRAWTACRRHRVDVARLIFRELVFSRPGSRGVPLGGGPTDC